MAIDKKKVLILGCNYNQVPYIKEIKKQGFFIIGVDKNNNAPGKSLCDKFFNVGYDDIDQLIGIAKEQLSIDDYIFTAGAQFAHYGAAKVALEIGISYPAPEVINKCLDKVLFYPWFQEWGLPIPKTAIIKDQDEFNDTISQYDQSDVLFLKSDYSKNPNYVYEFSPECIPDIVWTKDRYFRNYYVLQRKVEGESLRINIYADEYNVFKINEKIITKEFYEKVQKTNCVEELKRFVNGNGLNKWLVKFDIILSDNLEYVVLDIGIDPPSRMVHSFRLMGLNFEKHYINQYFFNTKSYPNINDYFQFDQQQKFPVFIFGLHDLNMEIIRQIKAKKNCYLIGIDRNKLATCKDDVDYMFNVSYSDINMISTLIKNSSVDEFKVICGTTCQDSLISQLKLYEKHQLNCDIDTAPIFETIDKVRLDHRLKELGLPSSNVIALNDHHFKNLDNNKKCIKSNREKNVSVIICDSNESADIPFESAVVSDFINGTEYRVDVFPDGSMLFLIKLDGDNIYETLNNVPESVIETVGTFHNAQNLDRFITKYDVIYNDKAYIIDVGFDYPIRFCGLLLKMGINPWEMLVDYYFGESVDFKELVSKVSGKNYKVRGLDVIE